MCVCVQVSENASSHRCRRVQSGSCGFTRSRLEVYGFIQVRVCPLSSAMESQFSFGFACVQSGAHRCRRVHSGSGEFTRARIWVVGIILVHVGCA